MKNMIITALLVLVLVLFYINYGLRRQGQDYAKGLWSCFEERDGYLENIRKLQSEINLKNLGI